MVNYVFASTFDLYILSVETLPEIFQSIAYALPLVYIFEETRNILVNQSVNYSTILQALYLNTAHLVTSILVFYYSFDKARIKEL